MNVYTSEQIRILDNAYLDFASVTHYELVQLAAEQLFRQFKELIPPEGQQVVVFAGPGNNGADALALARLLAGAEYEVRVYLFSARRKLSESCLAAWAEVKQNELIVSEEVVSSFVPPTLNEGCVVVDGLFGSGLSRPLEGGFAAVVRLINSFNALVVSVDVPSGLPSEGEIPSGDAIVKATITLTLESYKVNAFVREATPYWGVLRLVPLFAPEFEHDGVLLPMYEMIDWGVLRTLYKERCSWGEKRDYGHAYLVAGSEAMSGAALLASGAALRSGVGLLTVHVPSAVRWVVQMHMPEVIVESDVHPSWLTHATVKPYYSAVGVGPGIGVDDQTHEALIDLVESCTVPMVLDADALTIMSEYDNALAELPNHSILTPHVREFDRLFGVHFTSHQRLVKACEVAAARELIIVLKGAHTAVVLPSGKVYLTAVRNSGMAKGGSGDVLTGVILSLLAQGYAPADAAVLGCGAHALAGHHAARERGEHGMLPSDVIARLGDVFMKLV